MTFKSGFYKRHRLKIKSDINVTPFVDVMLVLLVIFMVTSPMLVSGVPVDLPKTKASPLAGSDEPISITVNRKGEIYIQETKVKLSELAIKLEAVLAEKSGTRIFVSGDVHVDYGRVIQVFSSIKEAGFTNIALVTKPIEQN